jgi:hypothetical protein
MIAAFLHTDTDTDSSCNFNYLNSLQWNVWLLGRCAGVETLQKWSMSAVKIAIPGLIVRKVDDRAARNTPSPPRIQLTEEFHFYEIPSQQPLSSLVAGHMATGTFAA